MAKAAKKTETQVESKSGFKVKKVLTLPVFSLKTEGSVVAFKVLDAMYVGKPQAGAEANDKPADICNVVNLETGEVGQIIVPAMLKSKFEADYEGDDYVGRGFEVENLGKKKGKSRTYNNYRIVELDLDA